MDSVNIDIVNVNKGIHRNTWQNYIVARFTGKLSWGRQGKKEEERGGDASRGRGITLLTAIIEDTASG